MTSKAARQVAKVDDQPRSYSLLQVLDNSNRFNCSFVANSRCRRSPTVSFDYRKLVGTFSQASANCRSVGHACRPHLLAHTICISCRFHVSVAESKSILSFVFEQHEVWLTWHSTLTRLRVDVFLVSMEVQYYIKQSFLLERNTVTFAGLFDWF
jgi:hypothetical protein